MKKAEPTIKEGYTVILATSYQIIAEALVRQLNNSRHKLIGILTRDTSQDVIKWASKNKIPLFILPIHLNECSIRKVMLLDVNYAIKVHKILEKLAILSPQIIASWGMNILPNSALTIPSVKFLNIHPSELPKYRGAYPLQAQILNSERSMRISIHETISKVDCGAIFSQSDEIVIENYDTMFSLFKKCVPVSASLFINTLDALLSGTYQIHQQPISKTETLPHAWGVKTELSKNSNSGESILLNHGILPRLKIDWHADSVGDIERSVRAFDMMGGPYTNYFDEILLIKAAYNFTKSITGVPGEVLDIKQNGSIVVQAYDGTLELVMESKYEKKYTLKIGNKFFSTLPVCQYTNIKNSDRINRLSKT